MIVPLLAVSALCRTPYGVRGLKLTDEHLTKFIKQSHLTWGAWIEMIDKLM